VVGLLYLDHPEPSLFDNDDAAFLNAFLKQAMSGISQGQQRYQQSADATQAREQARYLAYLNEIGSALTRSLDLTHVLQVIIERVNALLETERTSVFLIDEATNELILRYSNEDNADIRLPAPWQGIAGWVATHDEPTLVNDVRNDPRHLRQFALDTGYEAHSILCVPLKVEGHVIGVVEVLNKTGGQPFTLHHQALLTDLTQWAAIALHNARLFDERVRAYQHLAAEQQRRIAAETRNAMAAVVLDMAHTMNNIIGAIRVWAITLEQEPLNGPRGALHKQMVGSIRQNAEEAIELIRTMRGPLEQASVAPLDVNQCLNNAIRSCWHPENVTLHVNYGTRLPLVEANIARLEAVFQNVVSNAIQALTHEGGSIHIRTRRTSDGKAEIVISDNGPGIAPEIQEQLFTPGVSDREGRLGIGLWLVETFIRQFNGYIEWSSLPDTVTTFIITLPPAAGDIES
jgi:signal transduction histidine kinase